MPDDTTWPPKPDLPDPLTEYDGVIAAKLAALSETKAGPSRLLLIKALRDEEGMDLRQAYTLVNDYCYRHGLPVIERASRTRAYVVIASSLAVLASASLSWYLDLARDEARKQHRPIAEIQAITHAMRLNILVPAVIGVLLLSSLILRLWKRHKG